MRVTVRNLRKVVTAIYLNRVRCLFPANCVATITVDDAGLKALRMNRSFRIENIVDDVVPAPVEEVKSDTVSTTIVKSVSEISEFSEDEAPKAEEPAEEPKAEEPKAESHEAESHEVEAPAVEPKADEPKAEEPKPLPKNLDQLNRQALADLCKEHGIACENMTRKQMIAALKS